MTEDASPQARLLQADTRSALGSQGDGPWTVVYDSTRESNGSNRGWFSCFSPIEMREQVLASPSWDLIIGAGTPGFTKYGGAEERVEYLRYGTGDGIEPLVIIQEHYGMRPRMLPHVSEEFRLYHNLWLSPDGTQLIKVHDDGSDEVVAEIGERHVRIRTKYLRQFQAGRQLDLVLMVDSVRFVDDPAHTVQVGEVELTDLPSSVVADLYIGDHVHGPDEPFSRLLGKKLLTAPSLDKAGIWPFDERDETYPEFIIGEDEDGEAVRFTCEEEHLANYFGKNPEAPHYLTPVFFRREVLQRYYEHPEKYSVEDGYLHCGGLWGIRIDNDHPEHVSVWLGDLGRDLPESERNYWLAFNVPPAGAISETNFRRAMLAQATDPTAPDLLFRSRYMRFKNYWHTEQGWDLFKDLEPADEHVLQRLRIPLNDSQPELEDQVIGLTKLLVDSLNEKAIGQQLGSKVKDERGLGKLERWLKKHDYPHVDRDMAFLHRLQRLRSRMAAHRKGSDYTEFLEKEGVAAEPAIEVAKMLTDGRRFLHDLAAHFGIDLEPYE